MLATVQQRSQLMKLLSGQWWHRWKPTLPRPSSTLLVHPLTPCETRATRLNGWSRTIVHDRIIRSSEKLQSVEFDLHYITELFIPKKPSLSWKGKPQSLTTVATCKNANDTRTQQHSVCCNLQYNYHTACILMYASRWNVCRTRPIDQ